MALLEDLVDRTIVKECLPIFDASDIQSGALRWDDIADELEDDETL